MKFVESSNVVICACIKIFCVVYKRGPNSSPFPLEMSKISLHWKIWDFNGHFVDPLRARASTSMFSNGGRTNLLHSAYKAFTHCCDFEHTIILVRPLPSCQYFKWNNILSLLYEMSLLQNLHSTLHGLSCGIKYHGPHTFCFFSVK
jgi:hypothetical protein